MNFDSSLWRPHDEDGFFQYISLAVVIPQLGSKSSKTRLDVPSGSCRLAVNTSSYNMAHAIPNPIDSPVPWASPTFNRPGLLCSRPRLSRPKGPATPAVFEHCGSSSGPIAGTAAWWVFEEKLLDPVWVSGFDMHPGEDLLRSSVHIITSQEVRFESGR